MSAEATIQGEVQTAPDPLVDDLKARVESAFHVAYGAAGFADEDGNLDSIALAEKLLPIVLAAEATRKSERAAVCVRRRQLVADAFPNIAGPEGWADEADPEVAEGVYKKADSACWRLMAEKPDGVIQSRLNGDHGLVLCRTCVNPDKTWAVYVTNALDCLIEDAIKPQREQQKMRADRDAAFTAMLIERVPEHGKRFNRELVGGLRTALQSAEAITAGALQASLFEDDDVAGEE